MTVQHSCSPGRSRATTRRHLDAGKFPNAWRDETSGETPAPWWTPLCPSGTDDAPVASQALFLSRRVEGLTARVRELETYTATTRPSPTATPARVHSVGRTTTAFDDDSVRTAVATCPTRRAILQQLGVAHSSKNYRRLETRARTRCHTPSQKRDRTATTRRMTRHTNAHIHTHTTAGMTTGVA